MAALPRPRLSLAAVTDSSCLLPPQVYVLKRPHVDEFLQRMGQLFECVLFTASLAKVRPETCVLLPGAPSPHPNLSALHHHHPPSCQEPFVKVEGAIFTVTGSHPRWNGCRPCTHTHC